jgi:hypothetical protein
MMLAWKYIPHVSKMPMLACYWVSIVVKRAWIPYLKFYSLWFETKRVEFFLRGVLINE